MVLFSHVDIWVENALYAVEYVLERVVFEYHPTPAECMPATQQCRPPELMSGGGLSW